MGERVNMPRWWDDHCLQLRSKPEMRMLSDTLLANLDLRRAQRLVLTPACRTHSSMARLDLLCRVCGG